MTINELKSRIKDQIAEMQQIIIDGESWNDNNWHGHHIDLESDRVALSMARKALATLEGGDSKAAKKQWEEMCEYMKRAGFGS